MKNNYTYYKKVKYIIYIQTKKKILFTVSVRKPDGSVRKSTRLDNSSPYRTSFLADHPNDICMHLRSRG